MTSVATAAQRVVWYVLIGAAVFFTVLWLIPTVLYLLLDWYTAGGGVGE